jgi:two-component system response regulator HydG
VLNNGQRARVFVGAFTFRLRGIANRASRKILSEIMGRVLCVDDETHAAKLKCIILETAGHQATPATSVSEAISLLKSNDYDVIVTDWRLGDHNGREVVVAARKLNDTPVVVISGYVNEAFQAADPLADFYLEKPVNPEELISIVNSLMKSVQPAD